MSYQGYSTSADSAVDLYREKKFSGSAATFLVWIDGVQVAEVRQGRRVRLRVVPGEHRIQVGLSSAWAGRVQSSETLHFQVQPGEEIGFVCRYAKAGLLRERIAIERAGAMAAQQAGQTGSQVTKARVLGVRETERFEEQLGEEVRLIDNRRSPTPVTRSVKASREWTRTMTVGEDSSHTYGGEAGANLIWLSAKGHIEAEVQRNYSMVAGSTHLFEEEITISVPERTTVRVILRWKRIWQRGVVRIQVPDGTVREVPYQVVVNVTFDQSIQDSAELWDAGES